MPFRTEAVEIPSKLREHQQAAEAAEAAEAAVESAADDLDCQLRVACGLRMPRLEAFESEELNARYEVLQLRGVVATNPRAFESWLQLIKLVEELGTHGDARSVYMLFLDEFPLCWGFWKRLADLELSSDGLAESLATFERAVAACAPQVDIWVNYCHTAIQGKLAEEKIRDIFEQGLTNVGLDWRSGPLWECYLDFEERLGCWQNFGAVLRRALAVPMEALPSIRVRFRSLLAGDGCPDADVDLICGPDLLAELRLTAPRLPSGPAPLPSAPSAPPEIARAAALAAKAAAAEEERQRNTSTFQKKRQRKEALPCSAEEREDGEISDGEIDEGEINEEGKIEEKVQRDIVVEPDDVQMQQSQAPEEGLVSFEAQPVFGRLFSGLRLCPRRPQSPPRSEAAKRGKAEVLQAPLASSSAVAVVTESEAKRNWILEQFEAKYRATAAEAEKLKRFEVHIQRTYFHNRPISEKQLETWRQYLAFEEARCNDGGARLHALFRRCLVASNNYLEFWLRYASLLEHGETSGEGQGPGHCERACELFANACLSGRLRRRPDALIAWAEREEFAGRVDFARSLLDSALAGCGRGSAELALWRLGLERRLGAAEAKRRAEVAAAAGKASQESDLVAELLAAQWRCEALLQRLVAETKEGSLVRAFLARRLGRLQEELQRPDLARDTLLATWRSGCREASFLADLTIHLLRSSAGPGELRRAVGAFGEEEKFGQAMDVDNYGKAVSTAWGIDAKLGQCIAIFEEALESTTMRPGTSAHSQLQSLFVCYEELLKEQAAPLALLRLVRQRAVNMTRSIGGKRLLQTDAGLAAKEFRRL